MRSIVITSIKCEKKFGSEVKLHVAGSQCVAWTPFSQNETKAINCRVQLPNTPTNISLELFDKQVSQTLSASTQSVSTGSIPSASKTFSYRSAKGKYIITYRIEVATSGRQPQPVA
jgi:hypothetical protein